MGQGPHFFYTVSINTQHTRKSNEMKRFHGLKYRNPDVSDCFRGKLPDFVVSPH